MSPSQTLSWSHKAAGELLPGLVSPFTWSILGGAAEQAIRTYAAETGQTLPDQPVWRRHLGRAYVHAASWQAVDTALAGAAPALGRLLGRNRQAESLKQLIQETAEEMAALHRWTDGVNQTTWRQATILQVMEEVEPRAEAALLAGRRIAAALSSLRLQVEAALPEAGPAQAALLAGVVDPARPSRAYAAALARLARSAGQNAARTEFLTIYGHWGAEPLEAAAPRWAEAPEILHAYPTAQLNDQANPQELAARRAEAIKQAGKSLGLLARRQFEPLAAQLQPLIEARQTSRDHLVRVMAAARRWALGAAQEALDDGRLAALEDVFLLELEELKQMMTGEWSSPDRVRPIVEARRAEQAAWADQSPPARLV